MKRHLPFVLLTIIVLLLIAASVVEKYFGIDVAVRYVYAAPWTIALWAVTVGAALWRICSVKMYAQSFFTFLLHLAFVVILIGALVTHTTALRGEIRLTTNHLPSDTVRLENGNSHTLPFALSLTDFQVVRYLGTNAPMDFVSMVEVLSPEGTVLERGKIAMNHIFAYKHYRFYQKRYDDNGQGVTLAVSHDPWGIGITYSGYALLLVTVFLFFCQRKTHFHSLIRKVMPILLLFASITLEATPRTLPHAEAEAFGHLHVYYADRICPVQTLAQNFCQKIYGANNYENLSAEQVLSGWIFYYDEWAACPMIKIKGTKVRQTLGVEGKYAALNDFVGGGRYKLQTLLLEGETDARAADEKFQLISMVATASLLKIYPIPDSLGHITWYSWNDQLPASVPFENWQFVIGSSEWLALSVAQHNRNHVLKTIAKIADNQQTLAASVLPSPFKFKAEMLYNRFVAATKPLAVACVLLGLLLFAAYCWMLGKKRMLPKCVDITLTITMALLFGILTAALVLRTIVSGHAPLANGFETMQFLAWCVALLTLAWCAARNVNRKTRGMLNLLPIGFLLCGLTLMVSMMSAENPQITPLMPLLHSPLLSVHVAIIMLAYALLAFITLNAVVGLLQIAHRQHEAACRLQTLNQILLYPAIFCLALGIFIGALWANVAWGRYWGWDPKETWALITMIIYSLALHTRSLRWLNKPAALHLYCLLAFCSVLFTYFGVNLLLGGMHAYAS